MGTQETLTSDGAQMPRSDGQAEYVVQVRCTVYFDGEDGPQEDPGAAWADVATVVVPNRTKHKTAIERGLEQAGIEKTPELQARLLDAQAAYVWRARPPEPQALRLA